MGNSPALLADGINSTSDVVYLIIVKIFMKFAAEPEDDEHPYGHRQMETIASLVVGSFVITTAIAIFWDAINRVYDLWAGNSGFSGASRTALIVALFTVVFKIFLTVVTQRIGKRTNNPAIVALAYDHLNDIFAASAASIGIILGRMGYAWVDPFAGALVALVILQTGIHILRESSDDLMDTIPSKLLRTKIEHALADFSTVLDLEEMIAHRFGPFLVINLTIGIDGYSKVEEGDALAKMVELKLIKEIDFLRRVHIHYHPRGLKIQETV